MSAFVLDCSVAISWFEEKQTAGVAGVGMHDGAGRSRAAMRCGVVIHFHIDTCSLWAHPATAAGTP